MSKQYLKTFFEEKHVPYEAWDLKDAEGVDHYIDSDVVIEAILNAPAPEQKEIANILRQIDFRNGNVNHFLKHLAQGLVNNFWHKG